MNFIKKYLEKRRARIAEHRKAVDAELHMIDDIAVALGYSHSYVRKNIGPCYREYKQKRFDDMMGRANKAVSAIIGLDGVERVTDVDAVRHSTRPQWLVPSCDDSEANN